MAVKRSNLFGKMCNSRLPHNETLKYAALQNRTNSPFLSRSIHATYPLFRMTTCILKVPVLDNWWQTETAHAITSTCVGLGNSLEPPKDVTGVPLPGFDGEFEVWRFHLDSYRITQSMSSTVKLTMSNLKRYSYEQNEMMRYAGI